MTRLFALALAAALAVAPIAYAHEGHAHKVMGTVSTIHENHLEVKDKDGKIVHWAIETNSPGILSRAGWTRRSLKAGDEVTIILCPAKNGAPVAYIGSGDPGTKVIFSDGRELEFKEKTTAP